MTTVPDEPITSRHQRCLATTKAGQACRAWANDSGYCVGHWAAAHPNRVKGGLNSSKSKRIERLLSPRLRDLLTLLESAITGVTTGQVAPAQAQALSSLSNSLLRVYMAAEVELQLRHLEGMTRIAAPRMKALPPGRVKDDDIDGID